MKYDVHYAKQRLNNTIVRLGKKVVHLTSIGGWEYRALNLYTRKSETIQLNQADLNLNPIPLGYVNYKGNAYYLSRKPVRKWKQGLSLDSVHIREEKNKGFISKSDIMHSRSLVDCVNNKYPSLSQAFHAVYSGAVTSSAFGRTFSLRYDHKGKGLSLVLLYKEQKIGYVANDGIELNTNFEFLKEALQEAIL
jgi:hypothetical protein